MTVAKKKKLLSICILPSNAESMALLGHLFLLCQPLLGNFGVCGGGGTDRLKERKGKEQQKEDVCHSSTLLGTWQ
jgi:hypothetical protein